MSETNGNYFLAGNGGLTPAEQTHISGGHDRFDKGYGFMPFTRESQYEGAGIRISKKPNGRINSPEDRRQNRALDELLRGISPHLFDPSPKDKSAEEIKEENIRDRAAFLERVRGSAYSGNIDELMRNQGIGY